MRQTWWMLMLASLVPAVASAPGASTPSAALLTASGYVVARRQAVVSAKIQGRLTDLRVEEGSAVNSASYNRKQIRPPQLRKSGT